jgi:hypothetical protein
MGKRSTAEILARALDTHLASMTLVVVYGFAAGLAGREHWIAESIGTGLALYLMPAIGCKGGAALSTGSRRRLRLSR